jgi:hypothetical protein
VCTMQNVATIVAIVRHAPHHDGDILPPGRKSRNTTSIHRLAAPEHSRAETAGCYGGEEGSKEVLGTMPSVLVCQVT